MMTALAYENEQESSQTHESNLKDNSNGIFTFVKRLGSGGYSFVFEVTDPAGNHFAVKKSQTPQHVRNPMLRHEVCAMLLLAGHPAIPKPHALGRSQYFEYMVMDLLGESLSDFAEDRSRYGLHDVLGLLFQMLGVLEHLHSKHIIHRDIKPCNFVFGTEQRSGRLYLIDYGLARHYRDPRNLRHYPQSETQKFAGTSWYASINSHNKLGQSRRDDLESLAYSIASLLRGGLPWENLKFREQDRHIAFSYHKQMWTGARLFEGFPKELGEFLDYAHGLKYEEEPDYNHWRLTFRRLADSLQSSSVPLSVTAPAVVSEIISFTQPTKKRQPPVNKGDYVIVQISQVAGSEETFAPRPAIVLNVVDKEDFMGRFKIFVSPLLLRRSPDDDAECVVRMTSMAEPEQERAVMPSPPWPTEDVYHTFLYVSFNVTTTHCDQSFVKAHWKLDESQQEFMSKCVRRKRLSTQREIKWKMMAVSEPIVACISPLTPTDIPQFDNVDSSSIRWEGASGFWNDIERVRSIEAGLGGNKLSGGEEYEENNSVADFSEGYYPFWSQKGVVCGISSACAFGDEHAMVKGSIISITRPVVRVGTEDDNVNKDEKMFD